MSSPTVSLQRSGIAAQTAATAVVVSVPQAPPEMTALPAGLILPAVLIPAENQTETAMMQLTLPDGKELNIPIKSPHMLWGPTPVSIKILPFDLKKEMNLRIHFSAPLPDVKKAAEDLPKTIKTNETVPSLPTGRTISVRAFVMHSVPEQITALMNKLESMESSRPPLLKPNQTVQLELFTHPEQTNSQSESNNTLFKTPEAKQFDTYNLQITEKTQNKEAPKIQSSVSETSSPFSKTPASETPQTDVFPIKEKNVFQNETQSIPKQSQPSDKNIPRQPSFVRATTPEQSVPPDVPSRTNVYEAPKQQMLSQSKPSEVFETTTGLKNTFSETEKNVSAPVRQTERSHLTPLIQQNKTDNENIPVRIPLKGVVFDFKDRSASLVVTKIGVLALEEKIQIPHLTPVKVQITEIEAPLFSASQTKTEHDFFQNLSDTLNILKKADAPVFEAIKNILPQVGNKLPAQIFSFINMVSQNAPLATFIGEANIASIQNIGEKGHSLIKGIEKDFASSSKKVSDGRNSWSGWNIPFLSGAIVEPVSLYIQKPQENEHRQTKFRQKANTVRFLLDLNLTHLGKIQMDGLAHRTERRFDLIVRHQDSLPQSFDDKIHFIFTQTLSALNYTGTVKVDYTNQFIVFTEHFETKQKQGVWA